MMVKKISNICVNNNISNLLNAYIICPLMYTQATIVDSGATDNFYHPKTPGMIKVKRTSTINVNLPNSTTSKSERIGKLNFNNFPAQSTKDTSCQTSKQAYYCLES